MSDTRSNSFLTGPMWSIYAKTALPIIFVMGMNGLLSVADALFLGRYVGPDALAAVTLMFPLYMLIIALATLVSSGMSSLLARHLGAGRLDQAQAVFAGAHGLALTVAAILIALFFVAGVAAANLAAGGSAALADMGLTYLRITVLFSPLLFVLSVNSDTLRNEGRVALMAGTSLLVSLANIAFNYLLIAVLEMGVAGSAYGTALAQAFAMCCIITFRIWGRTDLTLRILRENSLMHGWQRILQLGAPQSLGFIGMALGSATIMGALQFVNSPDYQATISAYGIITRVMTFVFLPLLGLSHAMQTITGNNFGAAQRHRSNNSVSFAVLTALIYCTTAQLVMQTLAGPIGAAFVENPQVIAQVERILPTITLAFFLSGPLMMISAYFQATGDATRAALLSLSKPYLFSIPMTCILTLTMGEDGIWIAGPIAELCLLTLTIAVLTYTARQKSLRWGIFHTITGEQS